MVSEKYLTQQANRLLQLPFAPADNEDKRIRLDDFKRILRERVLTEAHCKMVVDYLVDHASRCPPPKEVIEAADEVKAPDKAKAPLGCDKCQGSGYISFTKRVHVSGMDPYDADFAKECDCALGEFKRAAWVRMKEGKR